MVICHEGLFAKAAEQLHHRKVELAVPTMGGWVDEPALSISVDDSVAGPEVAVQPRWWLVCGGELF